MGHICVNLPNTNNKWVGFGLANVDTFIIRVGFGLANVDTIRILTRHEHDPLTRIATPNRNGNTQKGSQKPITEASLTVVLRHKNQLMK